MVTPLPELRLLIMVNVVYRYIIQVILRVHGLGYVDRKPAGSTLLRKLEVVFVLTIDLFVFMRKGFL
jgi:hypothetical protein